MFCRDAVTIKILALSDRVEPFVHSPAVRRLYGDVDIVLGCGDLPHYYLEYIVTMLGGPLFYVVGNHKLELSRRYGSAEEWVYPAGCENIHGRVVRYRRLLLAGLEGSMRYNDEEGFQYTEHEMMMQVWRLAPSLLWNRLRYGRYLDILVTHAPPQGIHDQPDPCHRGFAAFRRFMEWFRPRLLVHGHVHVYRPDQETETLYGQTHVVNAYGARLVQLDERELR